MVLAYACTKFFFFFFFKYGSNWGVTIPGPEFERQCSSSRKASVVIGGSGGYLEGYLEGSAFLPMFFFVHCPHIRMVCYISQYTGWFFRE